MIKPGKKYRTRNKREVLALSINNPYPYSVCVRDIITHEYFYLLENGKVFKNPNQNHPIDLIIPHEEIAEPFSLKFMPAYLVNCSGNIIEGWAHYISDYLALFTKDKNNFKKYPVGDMNKKGVFFNYNSAINCSNNIKNSKLPTHAKR